MGRRDASRCCRRSACAAPDGSLDAGRARQHPARRRGRGRGRAGGGRARPTTTAAASGRPWRWPSASPACRTSPSGCRRRREEVVRLIMWEIGKSLADSREGVRPHRRLHPRHDRGAEGAGQRQLALPGRRGHDRPDPPHAAGRRPVHGAVQLPAQRDLRDADPGADHGQHHGVQAAALRRRCCSSRCWRRSASAFPPGRDQHRLRPGLGGRAAAAGLRQGQRADR